MRLIALTKKLIYKYNCQSSAYDHVIILDSKVLINGIKHVIFEHNFISAN